MSKSAPPVFMLSTPKNVISNTAQASMSNLVKQGFNRVMPFQGVVRSTNKSKIVMDGWKKFFSMLEMDKGLNEGIIIAEDDVLWEETWAKTKKRMKMDKINWLCYQKLFKEKQRDGTTKEIPVGTQMLYIPKPMLKKYKEAILKAKSIHFDRWNSRQPDIYYPYKPHEVCAEIESVSGTTGKLRKGAKVSSYEQRPTLSSYQRGTFITKFAGIPLLNWRKLLRKELSGKRFKIVKK